MRKIIYALFLILFVGVNSFAQKKSGTIYSDHETIDMTRELWKAFENADLEKYASYFADSAYFSSNGDLPKKKTAIGDASKNLTWWKENFVNLKITDHKPAYPDAMVYKDGNTWVQDWILVTATHKKSGINLNLPIHNMYSFNDEGKVVMMHSYFDNDIFEEITNSKATKENGTVYINHPHIVIVRKVVNAYVDKNAKEWASYFSPKARFGHYSMEFGKTLSWDENMELLEEKVFSSDKKTVVEQIGYPDCIFYEKTGQYVVYSWWKVINIVEDGKEVYSVMLTHNFNKEGKIVFESVDLTSSRSK
jgi:ketosteroid isomerase-like protein